MAKHSRRGNGEGTITRRKDGRWEAKITLVDGRRKSLYGTTRQEVARKLTEARRALDMGMSVIADERLSVKEYCAQWLDQMQPPRVRPSTHKSYRLLLAHLTRAYGDVRLTRLTAAHLATLYASVQRPDRAGAQEEGRGVQRRGISSTTTRHLHTVVRQALDDAVKLGLMVMNPAERVDAPKLRRGQVESLTPEETQRLLEAARGDRLEALYVLAATTGMRQGELLGLTWRQVRLEASKLQVVASLQWVGKESGHGDAWQLGEPKTARSRRQIRLSATAVEALRSHRARQAAERLAAGAAWQDNDLVFCNQIGLSLSPLSVTRYEYRRLLERAGLPRKRFHDLRHTAATLMMLGGTPTKVVSEMLGHSTIVITLDTYSHVLPDMQDRAAEVMDELLSPGRLAGGGSGASGL